jgi:hypothetical protein
VITKRIDSNATHFGIFSANVVLRDVRLHFIAHCFINCHLSRDCSAASSFGTATSFQQRTAAARRRLSHRGRTLALRQRPAKLSFHRSDRVRLLTSNELSLTTNITSRNTTTATAT